MVYLRKEADVLEHRHTKYNTRYSVLWKKREFS
jgi:hypothetical protein